MEEGFQPKSRKGHHGGRGQHQHHHAQMQQFAPPDAFNPMWMDPKAPPFMAPGLLGMVPSAHMYNHRMPPMGPHGYWMPFHPSMMGPAGPMWAPPTPAFPLAMGQPVGSTHGKPPPPPPSGPQRSSGSFGGSGKRPMEWREGDWFCPHCTRHNYRTRNACRQCGAANPAPGVYSSRPMARHPSDKFASQCAPPPPPPPPPAEDGSKQPAQPESEQEPAAAQEGEGKEERAEQQDAATQEGNDTEGEKEQARSVDGSGSC